MQLAQGKHIGAVEQRPGPVFTGVTEGPQPLTVARCHRHLDRVLHAVLPPNCFHSVDHLCDRGRRIEEQIGLLRRLWAEPVFDFEGRYDRIASAGINPLPPGGSIPIWMGGTSDPVIERVGRLALDVGHHVILFLLLGPVGLRTLGIVVALVEGGRYAYRRIRPANVDTPISDEDLAATFDTHRSTR